MAGTLQQATGEWPIDVEDTAPSLLVTIDTEEEGLWNGGYKSHGNTVRNIQGLKRFHAFCGRFGIRPTYLVDSPVIDDTVSCGILRDFHEDGQCEIGAHLHPWCAPPLSESDGGRNSFMCNLPESLQRDKLIQLTETIEERFDRRPTSFRAGRYGLDIAGAQILRQLGYIVDSSVISFANYAPQGGPDFRQAPFQPYWIGDEDLNTPSTEGGLLEVPVSVGFSRRHFDRCQLMYQLGQHPLVRRCHVLGVLDRLNLMRRIKFSPEQADSVRMKRLVEMYLKNGAICLVMLLHSSSLVAGLSPYVPDPARLERLYADLGDTFEYCLGEQKLRPRTLTGFAKNYSQAYRHHGVLRN